MIIRDHCKPGNWRNREGWLPQCEWPDDCIVQWGDEGLVLAHETGDSYFTAFFEAFPVDPKTFIRGEGADIDAAERDAFAKLQRYQACPSHEFEARGYKNGLGFCKHCNMSQSGTVPPTNPCCVCGQLTWHAEDNRGLWWCKTHWPDAPVEVLCPIAIRMRREEPEFFRFFHKWKITRTPKLRYWWEQWSRLQSRHLQGTITSRQRQRLRMARNYCQQYITALRLEQKRAAKTP